jgi:hypothetical protein
MRCEECGCRRDDLARGWRAYRADDPDHEEPELVFYCPSCAKREFGPASVDDDAAASRS